jgi:DNA polymerase-3 subunit epsilon
VTAWWTGHAVGLDTETDDKNPDDARIITANVTIIRPGTRPESLDWLAQPERDIPAEATEVHGVTTEHAREHGKPREEVIGGIANTLRVANLYRPVVAHNASYDLTVLDRELRRLDLGSVGTSADGLCAIRMDGREVAAFPVIDTIVIDRHVDTYRPGPVDADGNKLPGRNSLGIAAPVYGVELLADEAHAANADVRACLRMLIAIARRCAMPFPQVVELYAGRRKPHEIAGRFGKLRKLSLAELHAAQIGWSAEQAAGLAQYFREHPERGVDPDDVSGEWPLRRMP